MKCLHILVLYFGKKRKIQGVFIALFIISHAFVIVLLSMQRWNIVNKGAEAFCSEEELIAIDLYLIIYVLKIKIWSRANTWENSKEHTVSPGEKSHCQKGSEIKLNIQEGEKILPFGDCIHFYANCPHFCFPCFNSQYSSSAMWRLSLATSSFPRLLW